MENARLLDERLRKIISEVSGRTGGEIKKNLLREFEAGFKAAMDRHSHEETMRILALLKNAINKFD
ncbi:hypothetical protein L9W92_14255 [Pelotomaculum terephthalicicum JT]|uniref:hypothetical protein n=1 Tax=Pelotomaculum TaxID=191373 RepID=UPI0009C9049F|nr:MULTISPECIES: hypothetical protein [Pelotomaculum]MCG9969187.1 hypothetical protein [Pelotomaculum terephthalicicum JT]OPX89949.1 MAG: hypothetical protein A4E54_00783 [Pelotomaculum sp. PtaB.Bin117]OPY62185.1 MAG: hypothetical protein A4E56_01530 [Pelotomaculum sp. PtaU1.Bin065]